MPIAVMWGLAFGISRPAPRGADGTTRQIVERFEASSNSPTHRAAHPADRRRHVEALEDCDLGGRRIRRPRRSCGRSGAAAVRVKLRVSSRRDQEDVFEAVPAPAVAWRRPPGRASRDVDRRRQWDGKTTTVGSWQPAQDSGREPLFCAADTFRPPPSSSRSGRARRRRHRSAKEGSARRRVFDAIQSGKPRAAIRFWSYRGRLHNRVNLMKSSTRSSGSAARAADGAPPRCCRARRTVASERSSAGARVHYRGRRTGIVLTKLEATAKGGSPSPWLTSSAADSLRGVGEAIDDLIPFSTDDYVEPPVPGQVVDGRTLDAARARARQTRPRTDGPNPSSSVRGHRRGRRDRGRRPRNGGGGARRGAPLDEAGAARRGGDAVLAPSSRARTSAGPAVNGSHHRRRQPPRRRGDGGSVSAGARPRLRGLRDGGLDVDLGIHGDAAALRNRRFRHRGRHHRPFVIMESGDQPRRPHRGAPGCGRG